MHFECILTAISLGRIFNPYERAKVVPKRKAARDAADRRGAGGVVAVLGGASGGVRRPAHRDVPREWRAEGAGLEGQVPRQVHHRARGLERFENSECSHGRDIPSVRLDGPMKEVSLTVFGSVMATCVRLRDLNMTSMPRLF